MKKQTSQRKILIFIDWFLPGYKAGGPVRSMANMVEYLKEDYAFYIYTSNKDHDGEVLEVINDKWLMFNDTARVYYSSKPGLKEVSSIISEVQPDVVYLNSVFSPVFTLAPLWFNRFGLKTKIAKVVFAPRGMFQKGALQLKAGKKRMFLNLVKPLLFKAKNITWHATDEQEVLDIKCEIGDRVHINEVSNIPTTLVKDYQIQLPDDEIRFVTISLVAEKKNHIYFLKLLKDIKVPLGKRLVYDIYGPIKDADYWERCKTVMADMPEQVQVNYKGSVIPTKVSETLQAYHYFVLPTLGENFGHAIFEALVNGIPVLLSDQTPWRGLEAKRCGWDVALALRSGKVYELEAKLEQINESEVGRQKIEVQRQKAEDRGVEYDVHSAKSADSGWCSVLSTLLEMQPEEYRKWREGAKAMARQYIDAQNYDRAYKDLFK